MIRRDQIPWRELPHLRVKECAEIAGISPREMENRIGEAPLQIRRIGRIRFITVKSFRAWLGDEVEATEPAGDVVPLSARRRAKTLTQEMR